MGITPTHAALKLNKSYEELSQTIELLTSLKQRQISRKEKCPLLTVVVSILEWQAEAVD